MVLGDTTHATRVGMPLGGCTARVCALAGQPRGVVSINLAASQGRRQRTEKKRNLLFFILNSASGSESASGSDFVT